MDGIVKGGRYVTLDSFLAGFLYMRGIKPELNMMSSGKVAFAYDPTPELMENVDKYFEGVKADLQLYASSVKRVKGMIHEYRREHMNGV